MSTALVVSFVVSFILGSIGAWVFLSYRKKEVERTIRSVKDGYWHDPSTWDLCRQPRPGDRVTVSHTVKLTEDMDMNKRTYKVIGTGKV